MDDHPSVLFHTHRTLLSSRIPAFKTKGQTEKKVARSTQLGISSPVGVRRDSVSSQFLCCAHRTAFSSCRILVDSRCVSVVANYYKQGVAMSKEAIAEWADELLEIRAELKLDERLYPTELGLSFIQVESHGNEFAHRVGSQYWGLLQMGRHAGIDVGLVDRRGRTTKMLHGNGELAIEYWYRYMERYRARWDYKNSGVDLHIRAAVLWKGGAGTARRIRDKVKSGEMDFWQAVAWIEKNPKRKWRIPNLAKYLRRMQRAHDVWEPWAKSYVSELEETKPLPDISQVTAGEQMVTNLIRGAIGIIQKRFWG